MAHPKRSSEHGDALVHYGVTDGADELGACGRLLFRFRDRNPITGTPYVGSLWEDLPYFIGRLVCEWWEITPEQWNRLAACGQAAVLVGEDTYSVPLSLAPATPPTTVLPIAGGFSRCPDCDGRGVVADLDGQMTGFVGAVYVCFCCEPVRILEPALDEGRRAVPVALVGERL